MAQGPPPDAAAARLDREETTRRQMEDAERIRAIETAAQREATENLAKVLAEEKRLTAAQTAAVERLNRAGAAARDMKAYLETLERARAEAQERIGKREAILQRLLPAMLRMSKYPMDTMLGSPLPPEDTIRGLILVRYLARQAVADVDALTEDRKALEAATHAATETAPRLAAAEAARAREADALAPQLAEIQARRDAAEQEATAAARRAAAEAARAKTLRDMLQTLETQRRLEEAKAREDVLRAERDQKTAAAEAARMRQAAMSRAAGAGTLAANAKPAGQLVQPVSGTLLRGWGDPEDGEPATGQSWQTESDAQVMAPCAGAVVFAEPFRGYGMLVIVDCGGGHHAVLSGLDRTLVAPGRSVAAGDPIGAMRSDPDGSAGAAAPPVLYLELRKGGRPVNPAPWIRSAG